MEGLTDYEIEELAEKITLALDDIIHCSQIREVISETLVDYFDTKGLHKRYIW